MLSNLDVDVPPSNETPLAVRLVVGEGNHAGVTAEIREGIYMIGRHRECQIRPKSHSVEDRHCLVQHQSGVVRVFDLESEAGTFVNNVRLQPKTWRILHHGDRLRCGKYWFDVAIYYREMNDDQDSLSDSTGDDLLSPTRQTMQVAEADLFADEDFTIDEFSDSDNVPSDHKLEASLTADHPVEAEPQQSSKRRSKSRYSRLPKPKIKNVSASSGGGFSLATPSADAWKTILACLIAVLVTGYAGWSTYKLQKGPPVKILRGID